MKLPRDISGRHLARSLCRHWDYREVHQTGSHRSVAVHKKLSREDILATL